MRNQSKLSCFPSTMDSKMVYALCTLLWVGIFVEVTSILKGHKIVLMPEQEIVSFIVNNFRLFISEYSDSEDPIMDFSALS